MKHFFGATAPISLRLRAYVLRGLLLAGSVAGGLAAAPVEAAVTRNDVLLAARALSFTENPPSGDVMVGIVFTPSSAQSEMEAQSLLQILGDGLKVGNIILRPSMVNVENIAAANSKLFFLTDGMNATDGMKVAAASKARSTPCITVDIVQVQRGACIMGVKSSPKVEILVNRAAAASSNVNFATVFRMMITEF